MEISKKVIIGISGLELNNKEVAIIKQYAPLGYILFSRNIDNKDQVRNLIGKIRDISEWQCPILIDQEGGRVQRMTEPNWPLYPPANIFEDLANISIEAAKKAVYLNYKLLGNDLNELGININCAPCLDVKSKYTHAIIGDRSFSSKPAEVSTLGFSACNGLIDSGVLPVIKHIPGHGRARLDSHSSLPIIKDKIDHLNNKDFLPFKTLYNMPLAMTAHILYKDIDDNFCVTQSKKAYNFIRSKLNFEGILISDDIGMGALSGSIKEKVKLIIDAGYDIILECSGSINKSEEVLKNTPKLNKSLVKKWKSCLSMTISETNLSDKLNDITEVKKIFNDLLHLELDYY